MEEMPDEELEKWMKESIEEVKHWTLEELTDNFTCYPIWWNEAICFLQNPKMCVPSCLLGEDELMYYDYAEM